MTQREAKECAREAWIGCAQSARINEPMEQVRAEANVHFERWWKRQRSFLPGFRR